MRKEYGQTAANRIQDQECIYDACYDVSHEIWGSFAKH